MSNTYNEITGLTKRQMNKHGNKSFKIFFSSYTGKEYE